MNIFVAVCEHAYSLAQNLDPKSEGRGVLQFKTGLMSVVKVRFSHVMPLFVKIVVDDDDPCVTHNLETRESAFSFSFEFFFPWFCILIHYYVLVHFSKS